MDARGTLGRAAEALAVRVLRRAGLAVVARNARLRGGELDVVCRAGPRGRRADGPTWVFVEVKCRGAGWDTGPAAAVTAAKRRRLVRLAVAWLARHRALGAPVRFDVVAVTREADGRLSARHLPGAFDASPGA